MVRRQDHGSQATHLLDRVQLVNMLHAAFYCAGICSGMCSIIHHRYFYWQPMVQMYDQINWLERHLERAVITLLIVTYLQKGGSNTRLHNAL